jgi:two-component system sensor histidine kinase KdpD
MKGKFKIFLGYAAGTGKTYRMLEDGQKLRQQGVDVVIGYFERHGRKDTIAKAEGLELVPRRIMKYRGSRFEEMDTDAILQRQPQVCLVDELAHTNVPGSARSKRWEDVMLILGAGIDVSSTVNLQHLESLNDQMAQITGAQVRETVPDWVIKEADEVVMIDLTPEALINRIKRGVVYDPKKAEQALNNFFKESKLSALRELALRQAALQVELPETRPIAPDRILVHITADPATAMLIRRGRRVADYLGAECLAVCVSPSGDLASLPGEERAATEQHLRFARHLRLETRILQGEHLASALVDFARRQKVTQMFMVRSVFRRAPTLRRNLLFEVLRLAPDMQITVVAERRARKVMS